MLNDAALQEVIKPMVIKYGENVILQILENAESNIKNENIFLWFKLQLVEAMLDTDLEFFQERDFENSFLERKELTKKQQAAKAARAARREEK